MIVVDLQGTLFNGKEAIAKAKEFIDCVSKKYKIVVLTNSSLYSTSEAKEMLKKINFEGETITAATMTINVLKKRNLSKPIVFAEKVFVNELIKSGIVPTLFEDHHQEIASEAELKSDVDCVVVANDLGFTIEKAGLGVRYCLERKVPLFSVDFDRIFPSENGFILGSYSISRCVSKASGIEAEIIGKPSLNLIECFPHLKDAQIVIGDNIETDIEFGKRINAKTILVSKENPIGNINFLI